MENNEKVAVIVTLHYFYEGNFREVEYQQLGRLHTVAPEALTAGEFLVALSHEVEVPTSLLEDPYEDKLKHYLQEQGFEVLGVSSKEEFNKALEYLL